MGCKDHLMKMTEPVLRHLASLYPHDLVNSRKTQSAFLLAQITIRKLDR